MGTLLCPLTTAVPNLIERATKKEWPRKKKRERESVFS